MWSTILRKHSACSLRTRLGPWLCLNIVPDTHSEPQTCQCGHVSPHHSPYIDMLHSLPWEIWHGHLSLSDGPFAQFPPNKLSILFLIRLGLTEEFLWTFSCPLLSLYLKWPLSIRYWCVVLIVIGFANFHKCLTKGALNVKQIAREYSRPPLGSYVLNVCIGRVAYVSTLLSLQQHGQTRPHWFNLVYNTTVLHV